MKTLAVFALFLVALVLAEEVQQETEDAQESVRTKRGLLGYGGYGYGGYGYPAYSYSRIIRPYYGGYYGGYYPRAYGGYGFGQGIGYGGYYW